MPLDARVKRFLDILAAANPPSVLTTSVNERRESLGALMNFRGAAAPVESTAETHCPGPGGDIRLRLYAPVAVPGEAGGAARAGLVYFHGGGMVAGSLDTHDAIARALAESAACRVVSVDYRLGPEHRFPAAVEDAFTATLHVVDHAADFGIDPARLGICGDSAGGTLAAATCQALARRGAPRIALQVLLCPILDYSRLTESRREFGHGYLVDQATLDHDLLHYLPAAADAADPRVSPLRAADLRGLPPTVIHTAEFDPLRDEGRLYAERLRDSGCSVTYRCHAGMIHLFYGLGGVIPYARQAWSELGREVRAALGT
jgi:acetyl esterase/lipase